jgi:hypothetical protein
LSEVQVLGGLADEPHERIIRCGLEEARVKGRDELTQTNSVLRPSPALAFSKNWLASMSVVGQHETFPALARMSVPGGKADENSRKPDIGQ